VKILEAMAMGVPVVSTSLGAEGLAVRSGDHLLLADTPAAFALACAAVLRDPALAQRLVERAYRLVRERYAAPIAQQALDTAYSHIRARTAEGEDVPCASRS
jgi:glycosyltransferase involved in cell wall biosynthesis